MLGVRLKIQRYFRLGSPTIAVLVVWAQANDPASSIRAFHTHAATGFAWRYSSISRISTGLRRNSAERTICFACSAERIPTIAPGSEEHTSELQSPCNLVCRLL